MQYGPWLKRAFVASMVVGAALVAAPASADVTPCIGGIGPCPPTMSCNNDAECFGQGLGRCVHVGSSGGGTCAPDCNAAFTCSSDADCPTFSGLTANCRATAAPGVPGVCQYQDATLRPVVTLCVDAGTTVSALQIAQCFSGTSWALGDCDMDGVLNGVDAGPCDGTITGMTTPVPSPFCLAGHVCEGTSDVCAPFLRCSSTDPCIATAGHIGATGPWECSPAPGTSASFCHPSCDATLHCVGTLDCASLGACRPVDAALAMCVPMALSACASGCSTNPLDWASAQGDCDGDGAMNGCDLNPCRSGDTPCTVGHMCSLDAGVVTLDASIPDAAIGDAGSANIDSGNVGDDAASSDDAASADDASAQSDAGTVPMDGGNVAMDASTAPDAMPGLGFGGGGGCRCAVAGGHARGDAGAYLGLGIALIVIARRRRVTRR